MTRQSTFASRLNRLPSIFPPSPSRTRRRAKALTPDTANWGGMEQLETRLLMDACPGIIVYCAPGVGGAYDIYSVNADGTNTLNITQNAAFDAYPQVTEDGTMIAFTSNLANPASSARDVYTMNIDGSNLRRITFDGASWDPSLSYDKSKILFTSTGADGQYDIFVANSDGSGRYNASNSPRADSFASWSHDGQKIVFNSYRAANGVNNEEIYIMKFDGTEQTRLTYNPTRDTYAAISPDGTRIAWYCSRERGSSALSVNAHFPRLRQGAFGRRLLRSS